MLAFSHVTDLRASLPSNNFSNFFHSLTAMYLSIIMSIILSLLALNPARLHGRIRNDIILVPIYSSMLDTLSVPSYDPPLACPHLSATA